MSKEMIISVNGREKKIAILDNGQVTEFYIERGEEGSGVVGNIYKGRVQRVLPGMQSAFVEIGLERDAFLYVSDFFDEEEEIERIMVDTKSKKPAEEIDREVTDQLVRARLEREKQMEKAQELAEPLANSNEIAPEVIEVKGEVTEETPEPENRNKRNKTRRGRREREELRQEEAQTKPAVEEVHVPIFEMDDNGFERIVDEDESTGDAFKDAYMQEAIIDKVRAVEFDMESTSTVEVGSIMDTVGSQGSTFERIADEDDNAEISTSADNKSRNRRNNNNRRGGKNKPTEARIAEPEVEAAAPVIEEVQTEEANSAAAKSSKPKRPAQKKAAKGKPKKKTEASIKESSDLSEMAVRRGGRRRRGPGNRPLNADGTETVDGEGAAAEPAEETPTTTNGNGYKGNSGNTGRGRRDNNRDRSQPTITDLLREGQEILVQIAKEPIARKGARITSHIALPGRYLVYMPTIEHVGVSRKVESGNERNRLRTAIQRIRNEEDVPSGGFIVRTAGIGVPEENLRDDARYLVRTWKDIKKSADKSKSPALVHQDLDLIQRILRDQLSEEFAAIRVDTEEEYLNIVEFINRIQPKMVNRVKLYTRDEPILDAFGVQEEVDKALKPRVWLKSGGYLVINQTEALVSIDVNTGKFVGKGNARLEDTITKTNMEAVDEIARQIRLRDLGGILVLDLIDMEDRRNRHKVMGALQEALSTDKSPTKVLSFNDFGLVIMTRKRVKQSLERTMCSPCSYCQGAGLVKSAQTICYEILNEARHLGKGMDDVRQTTLRVNPEVAKALRSTEREVLTEIEDYLGSVDLTSDPAVHQEQFDFAFI